ncbi:MAG: hypothetical protein HC819_24395 [Cyclobacteriaceae bacterium]|nr:hypothetical protein [Cyclobacteriaceae bacterium]
MNVARKQQEDVEQREAESKTTSTPRKEKSTFDEVLSSPLSKQIGRELVRGVFGMLFGKTSPNRPPERRYLSQNRLSNLSLSTVN